MLCIGLAASVGGVALLFIPDDCVVLRDMLSVT